jgi:hypothetical protein
MKSGNEQSDKVGVLSLSIIRKIDAIRERGALIDEKKIVKLYWEIGREMVESDIATSDIVVLSESLQKKGMNPDDFSIENLSAMARFYRTYGTHEVLRNLVDAVSWPKHLEILNRCDNDRAQEFYIRMARKFDWSKEVLIHKIEDFRPPA